MNGTRKMGRGLMRIKNGCSRNLRQALKGRPSLSHGCSPWYKGQQKDTSPEGAIIIQPWVLTRGKRATKKHQALKERHDEDWLNG